VDRPFVDTAPRMLARMQAARACGALRHERRRRSVSPSQSSRRSRSSDAGRNACRGVARAACADRVPALRLAWMARLVVRFATRELGSRSWPADAARAAFQTRRVGPLRPRTLPDRPCRCDKKTRPRTGVPVLPRSSWEARRRRRGLLSSATAGSQSPSFPPRSALETQLVLDLEEPSREANKPCKFEACSRSRRLAPERPSRAGTNASGATRPALPAAGGGRPCGSRWTLLGPARPCWAVLDPAGPCWIQPDRAECRERWSGERDAD